MHRSQFRRRPSLQKLRFKPIFRIIFMNQGVICEEGNPKETFVRPTQNSDLGLMDYALAVGVC
ncbi:hypothetical protein IE4771_PD00174 (plasmid) [Rhizobium etli bv. mimosae str. IE4771]|uniref:Uncharacterized protein n=1 Tax=Rhizobium etli bv. mimosae str. IE4771 TaxID=1432050 RepID=A0A060IAM2_RHIET|nr:hypothetical protein IE4771_PD00174 [Rhizobium sp. IE4771]